jgi:Kef-type K+ transport system membrane component KefB
VHGDPIAPVILGVTSVLLFAVVGRFVARRLDQPTVVGELLMGILLGNVAWYLGVDLIVVLREGPLVFDIVSQTLAGASIDQVAISLFGESTGNEITRIITGPQGGQVMQVAQTVDVFSRYGVIFLLFMVGLETNLEEMQRVGTDSIRVAILGVLVPFGLGFASVAFLLPDMSLSSAMFIAATLGATSIGISANVLRETGHNNSTEGHIILGAAVCDDILGLIILAVVSGIVVSGSIDFSEVVFVILMSSLFLFGAVKLGPFIVRFAANLMGRFDIIEAKMFTSYLFVMVLAWVANLVGLATIIGAFAAGIVLSDSYFSQHETSKRKFVGIRELIMPLEVILLPIFFILMGIQVKIESFLSWQVIVVAGVLLVAAVAGKLISGLGARSSTNRLIIGIGMLPRGEVGLVFAAIGRTLGVINDAIFSAIVLMVVVTTLLAPPLLKAAIRQHERRQTRA